MKRLGKNETVMFALYELMDLLPSGFTPVFTPRLDELYVFLSKHEKLSPRLAAEMYLGTATKVKYFNKLRRRLKTALTRYLIAYPSITENKSVAFYETCFREFAMYKILLTKSRRAHGIKLAEGLLPELQKIELHGLCHIVANDLAVHYATFEVRPRFVEKYTHIAQTQLELANVESIVRQHYTRVVMLCNNKVSYSPKVVQEIIHASEQTWSLRQPGLQHINRLIYSIKLTRYSVEFDYENIIIHCNRALAELNEDHINISSLRLSYLFYKMPALLALEQLREAKDVAKTALTLVPKGYFNWHVILLRRIVVCLHAGDYQEAYDLYNAHRQKECLYENITEYWNIIRGYLYFLVKREKIDPYEKERFYLGKFLNEMPVFSKDKSGNNVNILIIQILVYMQRKQFGKIIDRIDSLKEYARVYMRNPETKRAKAFIDIIIKMEQAYFVKTAVLLKTEKQREKLNQTPIKLRQNLSIEVIPYGVLVEEILEMLDDKFRSSLRRKTTIRK